MMHSARIKTAADRERTAFALEAIDGESVTGRDEGF